MELRNLSAKLVIAGTIFIWIIKLVFRPYFDVGETWTFIFGIAPNLIGSFLVPFGAYWLYTHPRFFNGQLLRFNFFSDNRLVCLTGFTLVVINEYLQRLPVFGRTFDYYDLIFSVPGFVISFYSFGFLQRRLSAA
jgi:hypothetical protein